MEWHIKAEKESQKEVLRKKMCVTLLSRQTTKHEQIGCVIIVQIWMKLPSPITLINTSFQISSLKKVFRNIHLPTNKYCNNHASTKIKSLTWRIKRLLEIEQQLEENLILPFKKSSLHSCVPIFYHTFLTWTFWGDISFWEVDGLYKWYLWIRTGKLGVTSKLKTIYRSVPWTRPGAVL